MQKTGSGIAASQTKKPAGYRLVNTWLISDILAVDRQASTIQFVNMGRSSSIPTFSLALKKAPESYLGALCGQKRKPAGQW